MHRLADADRGQAARKLGGRGKLVGRDIPTADRARYKLGVQRGLGA